jgi:hypothetical protein
MLAVRQGGESNVEGRERCFALCKTDAFTSLSVLKALDDMSSLAGWRMSSQNVRAQAVE